MSDKIMFRKSFNGYNTQDVNNYIVEFNNRFKKNDEEKERIINELRARINELESEKLEKNEICSEENSSENNAKITELETEKEQLNEKIKELEAEKEQLISKIAELENGQVSDQSIIEKSNNYDKVSEQIGAIIMDAGAKAESIKNDAKIEAEREKEQLIENTKKSLGEINESYMKKIAEKAKELSDRLGGIAEEARLFESQTNEEFISECNNAGKENNDGGNTNE